MKWSGKIKDGDKLNVQSETDGETTEWMATTTTPTTTDYAPYHPNGDPPEKVLNPKDANGSWKPPTSAIPQGVVLELGAAMLEGALHYGAHNYRAAGVRASVYMNALDRHRIKWWDFGEDIDPDSGISHVTKAIATLVVLRDSMMMGNWIDDRPPPLPISVYEEIQNAVMGILAKYPEAVAPFTAKSVAFDKEHQDSRYAGGYSTEEDREAFETLARDYKKKMAGMIQNAGVKGDVGLSFSKAQALEAGLRGKKN